MVVYTTLAVWAYGQVQPGASSGLANQKGYVWTFSTRQGERNQLTQNLTTEFEEILVHKKIFSVLNRTKFASLFEQWEAEKSVRELGDLSDSSIHSLKVARADFVVFGELYEEKDNDLARVTVIFQHYDSEIFVKESHDAQLSKLGSSIVYREMQLNKLVDKIRNALSRKNKGKFNNLLHRDTYKKGFGIEIYPYAYEAKGPGIGASYQFHKRWGATIGILTEEFDGVLFWGGIKYDCINNPMNEDWSLLVGPSIGMGDFNKFLGFVDLKLRYKVFTLSAGLGYFDNYGFIPVAAGFHLPVD